MADGTISMVDGLGLKALDSNEVRRKQNLSNSGRSSHELQTCLANPIFTELQTPPNTSTSVHPISSSTGFGIQSPRSTENASISRKLQQVFMEEGRMLEAEKSASYINSNLYQSVNCDEVHTCNPNPTMLINARGIPYVQGDPNMGYPTADTKPRQPLTNAPPHYISKHVADTSKPDKGFESESPSHKSPLTDPHTQLHAAPNPQNQINSNSHNKPSLTHQPNPKSNSGQNKPKPKNWASLLHSQSPSLDMKLEYFPDLQKGKEALVEIDVELTEVGRWNRYLIGHFLDGKMAYHLLVSTARYQWKDLFVAVKPDVSGFYLFEFKSEQAKLQVLEGGPYFFSQKYLVLKDWHRMMKPLQDQPTKILAWVKFHDLPLELWNQECLSRVASTVGRPIHVDQATARTSKQPGLLHTKSTKARVCIEISAEHELPEEVAVTVQGETVVVPIEYQVLPPMCSHCHVFGHPTSKCAKHSVAPPSPPIELEWQVVSHGKQKTSVQPPKQKLVEQPPSSILSVATLPDHSNLGENTENTDDSDAELMEVLEGVVSSVAQGTSNSRKTTNPCSSDDNKLTENTEQSNKATN